jgi:hypothetical protein
MDCLIDYVGLYKGCGGTTPLSNLYVNQLPGITTKSIDKIANEDQVTYLNVWRDVQARASKRWELDVRRAFLNKYRIRNVTSSSSLGRQALIPTDVRPASAEWRGITIETDWFNVTNFVQSSLFTVYIQSLDFYAPINQVNTQIKIFDLITGEVIEDLSQDVVAGWNTIQVNKKYPYRRMFIGIDSTNFNSATFYLTNARFYRFYDCNATTYGAVADLGTPTTVIKSNNTWGLSGVFGVRCVWDGIVCNNKDQFALAWWYLLGVELMNERINSPRINTYTTINLDQAEALKKQFEGEYMGFVDAQGVFVPGALQQTVDGFDLDQSDCCIECNASFRIQENKNFFVPFRLERNENNNY